nr:uncharacterized protein LOC113822867 [Penaeus vannamei]
MSPKSMSRNSSIASEGSRVMLATLSESRGANDDRPIHGEDLIVTPFARSLRRSGPSGITTSTSPTCPPPSPGDQALRPVAPRHNPNPFRTEVSTLCSTFVPLSSSTLFSFSLFLMTNNKILVFMLRVCMWG